MILLGAVVGWFAGSWLNWAADFLPRFSENRTRDSANKAPRPRFALYELLAAGATGGGFRLPESLRLNLGVELFTALLAACMLARYPLSGGLILLFAFCLFLILLAIIDFKYRLVLNVLIFPAIALTLLIRCLAPGSNPLVALIGGSFGFAIFAAAALVRPGELGAGDIKLATWLGLFFGFPDALWALMVGILTGGLFAGILLTSRRGTRKSQMPYAPFLCLGALVALFYNPVPQILHSLLGR
jgi:leader peptidase (prepilin peptidase) / N-methyltransferase